jgi:hypothetical protein
LPNALARVQAYQRQRLMAFFRPPVRRPEFHPTSSTVTTPGMELPCTQSSAESTVAI